MTVGATPNNRPGSAAADPACDPKYALSRLKAASSLSIVVRIVSACEWLANSRRKRDQDAELFRRAA